MLERSLYLKTTHGGKSKSDRIDIGLDTVGDPLFETLLECLWFEDHQQATQTAARRNAVR